jgi:glutathione synthase/RimK-type ligase-like ATP-grasp enzyme
MTNNVLIISTKVDSATDDVVNRLNQRGISLHRLNTEDFPFTKTITYQPGCNPLLWIEDEPLPRPSSIWYRRVRTPGTPPGMDEGISNFCRTETRAAITGSIISTSARWMSTPSAIWESEHKPYQLTIAAQHGLTIPRTIITNNPTKIRQAYQEFNGMIVKPTRTGHLVKDGLEQAIYTSRVLSEHLDEIDSARWSTSIYQEHIPKRYDIRVTIVGDRVFTAAIDSQTDPTAITDWRQTNNPHLPHLRHTLPDALVERLVAYMRSLRLTFGAIDLIQTPNGDYVFLEVNPNGQWLWLDDTLGLGISDAIADWLTCND